MRKVFRKCTLQLLIFSLSCLLAIGPTSALAQEAPAGPSAMDKIWRAYNADKCEEAITMARKLIDDVGPRATILQKEMKEQSRPEPKTGPVSSKEEEEIFRQGAVNDVGAAWYVIGRCLIRNEQRDQAIKAFEESLRYPYARVYDPSNGGFFWSPAEDAGARLEFLRR